VFEEEVQFFHTEEEKKKHRRDMWMRKVEKMKS
jgi:hypothetical protein